MVNQGRNILWLIEFSPVLLTDHQLIYFYCYQFLAISYLLLPPPRNLGGKVGHRFQSQEMGWRRVEGSGKNSQSALTPLSKLEMLRLSLSCQFVQAGIQQGRDCYFQVTWAFLYPGSLDLLSCMRNPACWCWIAGEFVLLVSCSCYALSGLNL